MAELVRLLGHAAGGRPAERLMARLGMPVSDDTILRHLKRQPAASTGTPPVCRVVGIDHWSWIMGNRYGTSIVDLERRHVADVLPDRSAESTAHWLGEHPDVEIVSRDRCGLYAQGARQGAPQARQVADRFHLLQNLRERIEQRLSHGHAIEAPLPKVADPDPVRVAPSIASSPRGGPELAVHHHLVKQARRHVRQAMFDRVRALLDAGQSLIAIVRETGFNWRTVAKWARLDVFPLRRIMTPKPRSPAYCEAHLARRWAEGCTSGRPLLLEIQPLGYTGSRSHLECLLTQWRAAGPGCRTTPDPLPVRAAPAADPPPAATDPSTGHLISPVIAAVLCMKPRPLLTPGQVAKVQALKDASPEFVAMRRFVMRFRGIMRSGDIDKLVGWIDDVRHCGIYAMQRFGQSLLRDLDAVRHAMTEPWSNRQTEGRINRLKTLKRAMYSRAGVELLRACMMPLLRTVSDADLGTDQLL